MSLSITNKSQMYELLRSGRLGHTLPSAETEAEAHVLFAALPHADSWAVRSKTSGGPCVYYLQPAAALQVARQWGAGRWILSPTLADAHRLCYCHLVDRPGGWALHYTEVKKAARLNGRYGPESLLDGLAARLYVRRHADQRGYDTICELLEAYDGHVVESTCMASAQAAYGPSNVIIWEVRCASGPDVGLYERGGWY